MVCLMSRTAKRPRGGKSEKASTHMGLDGTNATINLLLDFVELASNMSGVAIQDWRVAIANLTGMVQDNDLSGEVLGGECRLVLGVGCDVSSRDDHTRFDDTSFDTTNGHCSNTADFVDILERQSQ